MTMPWDNDIDAILANRPPVDLDTSPRELMTEAWQFGYTCGMADSAIFERKIRESVETPSDLGELYRIIDNLWGFMPSQEVREIEAVMPGVTAACRAIHEVVSH